MGGIFERKAGSRFPYGGKILEVVPTERDVCDGCHFERHGGARRDCVHVPSLGECTHVMRADGMAVIFRVAKTKAGRKRITNQKRRKDD